MWFVLGINYLDNAMNSIIITEHMIMFILQSHQLELISNKMDINWLNANSWLYDGWNKTVLSYVYDGRDKCNLFTIVFVHSVFESLSLSKHQLLAKFRM